ncbi:MAG: DUF2442 domain-containing protein [Deltaproteobacteria bacterium]|nr:DUF2442 domain-containing protein [Deltaproteobacteria bacterium]MBI3017299.1 DUF2442 domain-containing protein [Deltaproteobacteria bacterium]
MNHLIFILQQKKIKTYPAILKVRIGQNTITAIMSDGREVSIPIAWFPRLAKASAKELNHYEISPGGYGIYWPDIDEDISIKAFLD